MWPTSWSSLVGFRLYYDKTDSLFSVYMLTIAWQKISSDRYFTDMAFKIIKTADIFGIEKISRVCKSRHLCFHYLVTENGGLMRRRILFDTCFSSIQICMHLHQALWLTTKRDVHGWSVGFVVIFIVWHVLLFLFVLFFSWCFVLSGTFERNVRCNILVLEYAPINGLIGDWRRNSDYNCFNEANCSGHAYEIDSAERKFYAIESKSCYNVSLYRYNFNFLISAYSQICCWISTWSTNVKEYRSRRRLSRFMRPSRGIYYN